MFVTGIGKSGLVASRMASSLMSIGVPAQYVHGTEWVHGGLGATRPGDVVVMLSNSGKTRELLDAAGHLIARGVTLVAIVGHPTSPLARTAHHVSACDAWSAASVRAAHAHWLLCRSCGHPRSRSCWAVSLRAA